MAKLLPSSSDVPPAVDGDPRIVGLDSDDAESVIAALSSETARQLLTALHEQPDSPAALADRIDTTLQNVQYHIKKLEEAALIEVVDTVYSEKGREMNVYAPADEPLVLFASKEPDRTGLKATLMRLLGGVGILGLASLLVQRFADRGGVPVQPGGEDAGAATTEDADTAESTATPSDDRSTETPAEAAEEPVADEVAESADATDDAGGTETIAEYTAELVEMIVNLEPGVAFFLGGVTVMLAVTALWYYQHH
ncbi:ArsR/SmtB family transcription factor [Natronocalculus amylovorans]|uniref:Helix-turn-helix domain-containing protein n=1 Tax=Natronocalculus amylovorans TaxID=2917812 RepID=A0AAE3FXX0_9EURY|nr:winged helix-turn-helix domain-containing protein [Natronocalculus amylovorans]MCL9816905.1 helix-turn-helix domain-containing protein [Natronocalculus amylovorans]NUE03034.1 helix-turn-helix transcriptional regulator [Halorubraceae archaeon YAN]